MDVTGITGSLCGAVAGDVGACYAGQCQSHTAQCRALNPQWTACPARADNGSDESCGTLFCALAGSTSRACFAARSNDGGGAVAVQDGTSCRASGGGRGGGGGAVGFFQPRDV